MTRDGLESDTPSVTRTIATDIKSIIDTESSGRLIFLSPLVSVVAGRSVALFSFVLQTAEKSFPPTTTASHICGRRIKDLLRAYPKTPHPRPLSPQAGRGENIFG